MFSRALLSLGVLFCLSTSIFIARTVNLGSTEAKSQESDVLSGKWTYRSFHNNPRQVEDNAQEALSLIFAEATFNFTLPSPTTISGTIDWPGGGLDLSGTVRNDSTAGGQVVAMVGTGRPGTGTEDWEYDYQGQLAHRWPNGVNQVPAIVGTVIRAKPHGQAKAGYVASFVAVKQP